MQATPNHTNDTLAKIFGVACGQTLPTLAELKTMELERTKSLNVYLADLATLYRRGWEAAVAELETAKLTAKHNAKHQEEREKTVADLRGENLRLRAETSKDPSVRLTSLRDHNAALERLNAEKSQQLLEASKEIERVQIEKSEIARDNDRLREQLGRLHEQAVKVPTEKCVSPEQAYGA